MQKPTAILLPVYYKAKKSASLHLKDRVGEKKINNLIVEEILI